MLAQTFFYRDKTLEWRKTEECYERYFNYMKRWMQMMMRTPMLVAMPRIVWSKSLLGGRKITDVEILSLNICNTVLTNIVMQQQRFFESMDADKRINNLIVTGVPEKNNLPTDYKKYSEAWLDRTMFRRGPYSIWENLMMTKSGTGPTHVVLEETKYMKDFLNDAAKLKNAGKRVAKIYVRRVMNPAIQKELIKIRKYEKTEKEKAENQGRVIQYDNTSRCIFVDGTIVDIVVLSFLKEWLTHTLSMISVNINGATSKLESKKCTELFN
jgi:hypothetical protein